MNDQLEFDHPGLVRIEHPAVLSDDKVYRYELRRRWGPGMLLEWVMLNPSTADADNDDPTIRRCISFAKAWGYDGIRVTNLFAYRATKPANLLTADDPFGPDNNTFLRAAEGPLTIVGWGTHRIVARRGEGRRPWSGLFDRATPLQCLGYCADGSPKHPLFIPATSTRLPWPKPEPKPEPQS